MRKFLLSGWTLFAALLLSLFNNCGRMSVQGVNAIDASSRSSASLAACDGALKAAYQRTYHPFLVTNCQGCHGTAHGSADIDVSFNAFKARGATLIDYQSTRAHGGNSLGPEKQAEIDVFKPSWTQAENDHLECLANSSMPDFASGSVANFRISDKVVPNLANTLNNNNWVTVEWDLENDCNPAIRGLYPVMLKFEARINKVNNVPSGILLRNPRMRLKASAGSNVEINGLSVFLDGVKQTQMTTYMGVTAIIAQTTDYQIAPGSAAAYGAYASIGANTTVGFELSEIKRTAQMPDMGGGGGVVTPTPVPIPDVPIPSAGVKHSELISGNSQYRVFNRSCVGCHNSGSGRLDLTNYDAARGASLTIIERMNSTASPMPPTGLLRQNDRDLVQSWVNAGHPK